MDVLLALCWIDLGETNDAARSDPDQKSDDVRALLVEARFWGHALCAAFSIGAFYTFLAGGGISGVLTVAGGAALTTLTGFLLTYANAPSMLIGIMLVVFFAGLLSATWIRHADRATAETMAPR